MKKNKRLLIIFLTFALYTEASTTIMPRYNRLYNNMVENIEKSKSNEQNYRLIEQTLNKINKELKDLYLQNDYVIKPEFLEWQIFFNGFYEEYGKGIDNSKENARYHSKVTGYYDTNGTYVTTSGIMGGLSGKPYQALQQPKEINLGINIPLKKITREPLNLNLLPMNEVSVKPNIPVINTPTSLTLPSLYPVSFQPVQPVISLPGLFSIPLISVGGAGGSNSGYTGFYPNGDPDKNSIISQMDLFSGKIEATTSGAAGTYTYTLTNLTGQKAAGLTAMNGIPIPSGIYSGSVTGTQAILKIIENPVTRYNAEITLGGGVTNPTYLEQILHYDEHYRNATHVKTISQLVSSGYISATEGNEFANKYLDSSVGDTITNKYLQYIVNTGQWSLKGNSVLAMNIQSHAAEGAAWIANIAFENKGSIIGLNEAVNTVSPQKHIAFMFTEGQNLYRYQVVDNTGLVELRAPESITYSLYNVSTGLNGKYVMLNNNEIKLYGVSNVGIYTRGQTSGSVANTQIKLFSPITVLGDESIGIDIERQLDFANSKIKVNVGTEDPRQTVISATGVGGLENSGEAAKTGYSNLFTDNGVGVYVNMASSPGAFTLKDYEINIGGFSQNSIGLRVENGSITLGSNMLDTSTKHSLISDGGIGNILLAGLGSSSLITVGSDTLLELKNGKAQVGMYANTGSSITNAGTLIASGDGTKGVVVDSGSIFSNTGNLNISGGVYTDSSNNKSGSVGIAVKNTGSSFTSTGVGSNVTIDVSGKESTGLFTDTGTINITNGNIKTSDGAFNLYAKGSTGKITLTNSILETGQRSLLFYNENGGTFDLTNVNALIRGSLNTDARGTAFYYVGSGTLPPLTTTGLSSYFSTVFNNTAGNLTLKMDSGSRLFIVDNVSIDLSVTATPLGSISGGPTVIGSDYKTYMMYKSLLGIDQGINLDSSTDAYNILEIVTSSISNNSQTITGTFSNQSAMAQENGLTPGGLALPRNTVVLTNNGGIITLGGTNSVGIYANNGEINNTGSGKINVTGLGSVGIYGVNGTLVNNSSGSSIEISTNGVGIFGEGYKQGTAQLFGDGKINIVNNGLIKSGISSDAIGIYANNNSTGNKTDSQINLSGGTIDLSNSERGIGVFVNKGTITDSGSTISVGKHGLGLYAVDSDVTLNGTIFNLNGDRAVGMYIKGNSDLMMPTAATFNVNGQETMLFYLDSTSSNVHTDFNIGSVSAGASYIVGKIDNGSITYTGNSTLKSNGVLIIGGHSEVIIDSSATITAAPGATNIAAVIVDGNYVSGSFIGRPNIEGENKGNIILGDNSVGILGRTGANLLNIGTVTVGNNSVALSSDGTATVGEVYNEGLITMGSNSQGIYLNQGTGKITGDLVNEGTGVITSTGDGSVGMFADDVNVTVNRGLISLTGNKSVGMYITGAIAYNTTNDGTIVVGDALNISDPSIGIYVDTPGETVTNNGTITSGKNSLGIYGDSLILTQNGTINVGDSGVGIYTTNSTVNLSNTSILNLGSNNSIGVYGISTNIINSSNLNVGDNNFGFILKNGSFNNNVGTNTTTGTNSVFLYSTEATTVTNDGILTMSGNDNIGFYTAADPISGIGGARVTNNGSIIGTTGKNNVGIYNYGGTVDNNGIISVGNSDLAFKKNQSNDKVIDVEHSKYSVGIYGENSIINNYNKVTAGIGGIGIVAKGGTAANHGRIETTGDYSMGMYTESGVLTNQSGAVIDVTGNNAIGMAGKGPNSQIINHGIINITGNDAIGMYGNLGTIITNTGTINISGSGQAIASSAPTDPHNVSTGTALVNGVLNNTIQSIGNTYDIPTLINAGIIKTNGVLALDGVQVLIKPDPGTKTPSLDPAYDFVLSGTSIIADEVLTSKPIVILPGFADGTIANIYKLESLIQASSGQYDFISGSLLWEAIPKATGTGADIYMSRKAFTEFTDGLWFEDFGRAMENNYLSAAGEGIEIYNKTGYIKTEEEFRHIIGSMAGNVYANMNQRENDISRTFENSLFTLQDSSNNTKENIKMSIIAGKGKNKEETDGVVGYDYTTTGVLALREVERTYKHTFGYSLGYLHTGFEFKDGNESEEWVDTIQLGVHNKYKVNGWEVRNDLTGRASIHNVDRNIDWESPLKRSEMNGTYETYSITSDNILGKELELGKRVSVMPYGGLRGMYVMRPSFKESGLERLEIEGNEAWSVKPRAGLELKGSAPLGSIWELKGSLDLAYEYELSDLNERERAKLISIEDGYHKLSKPQDEKGTFRTRASIGIEIEDRYGVFLTGEYKLGRDARDDYRAGVTLKAVF